MHLWYDLNNLWKITSCQNYTRTFSYKKENVGNVWHFIIYLFILCLYINTLPLQLKCESLLLCLIFCCKKYGHGYDREYWFFLKKCRNQLKRDFRTLPLESYKQPKSERTSEDSKTIVRSSLSQTQMSMCLYVQNNSNFTFAFWIHAYFNKNNF